MPLTVKQTPLPDVVEFVPTRFGDDRGYFMELGRASEFAEFGIDSFAQDNQSRSARGVLRGIHFQADPHPQGKLVRSVVGQVWDVAVDLRRWSDHFLDWTAVVLDADTSNMLWIPPGFGHGFVALTDPSVIHYKTTAFFDADLDRAVAWNDPDIGIDWPDLGIEFMVSAKDREAPRVADAELFDHR